MAMVKFLDYGGYLYVNADSLRVLRFKTLSFRIWTNDDDVLSLIAFLDKILW